MKYLIRRISFYLAALLVALSINFILPRMMPGDPVELIFANFQGRLDPSALETMKITYGFDEDATLFQQYWNYLSSTVKGDLGISISSFPTPVVEVIGRALPWTLLLVGTATLISYALGTLLGISAAWKRGGFVDVYLMPALSIFRNFPYFWIALIILYVFGLNLNWFPLSGAYDPALQIDWTSAEFVKSVIYYSILPIFTIVITSLGSTILGMRNYMIGVVTQDYVTLATAKGLIERRVKLTYAARNAMLPNVTGFALRLGFLIGGATVTEIVFSYPGMGFRLLQAVNARDYPLMQGIFLAITLTVLVTNFLVDVLYLFLDPRVRDS